MYVINEATIIASLAMPAGLFIGFLTILVTDFISACNDYLIYKELKKKSWFGLGEFINGISIDPYARY